MAGRVRINSKKAQQADAGVPVVLDEVSVGGDASKGRAAANELNVLKGLKFRTALAAPLRTEDVLDWKEYGSTVVIITKDGRKLTADKAE